MNDGGRHTEPLDVHLILRRDGETEPEVLLSRRAGSVYAAGLWHLPSGHLDGPHEDVVTALVRETREETDIVVDPADVHAAVTVHHRSPGGGARVGFFCEVRRWQGTPRIMEPNVCDGMDWFPLDDLPIPMVAYCRAGLDSYRAGARLAVHFQEPGDPIADDRTADRLRLVPDRGAGGGMPDPAVRDFAERAVGRITDWADVSWARESSRIWRARGAGGGVWFVKIHQNDRFHDREVTAYRNWVPGLGAAAPRLVAADHELRAVVVTAVPGRPLHGAVHTPVEQQSIFRSIGQLAAAIHRSTRRRPYGPGDDAPLEKLERHLDAARPHLGPGDEEFIRTVAKRAEALPVLDAVVTHGDFQLRNLLLADDGSLHLVDFERSEEGPAVRDFARLSDAWANRPDPYESLMVGYGRPLTQIEEERLAVESALDSLSGIQYGRRMGDPELVERGRRTLARLRAAHRCTSTSPFLGSSERLTP
ncbi:phosphotransferase [Streptomyces sp. Ncost-T10-10d]|uniref:phosphotransferase n=1 Tax=Streptomyces sp. Ncost-T10-10d TaxID=1839774 RepID=UPI00081F4153|nr:phosphotransferase [Streptomyces sp. Ncost-T10-10d]SCF95675.1 ADP-ribose pyrophosphatase YjhB, NUDIX family [Streptomyces sp. Ncost-T10-10d]